MSVAPCATLSKPTRLAVQIGRWPFNPTLAPADHCVDVPAAPTSRWSSIQELMGEFKRPWVTSELHRILVLLARPGEATLADPKVGPLWADELALDYDCFVLAFTSNLAAELTVSQRSALLHVHGLLAAMSGQHQAHLWSVQAIVDHPRWGEVRIAAQRALELIAWPEP